MSSLLEVNNLNVSYGNVRALSGISMKAEKGEIVAVIGSNGAGKSTLIKAVAGLIRCESGYVKFRGEDVTAKSAAHRVDEGMICTLERRQLFNRMTTMENLELGAYTKRARGKIRDNLTMIFHLFPILEERKKQLAGTLSGGEQQMLAISRALMAMPELMMLDEPSLGLAPKVVVKIFETVKNINQKDGITMMLVEQNASKALDLSTRGYVVENGRIIKEGKSEDLKNDPSVRKAYLGM